MGQLSKFLRCVLLKAANYGWFFFRFHPRVVQSLRSHQISICHCNSELSIGTRLHGAERDRPANFFCLNALFGLEIAREALLATRLGQIVPKNEIKG